MLQILDGEVKTPELEHTPNCLRRNIKICKAELKLGFAKHLTPRRADETKSTLRQFWKHYTHWPQPKYIRGMRVIVDL